MSRAEQWRKASYSASASQCVELNRTLDAVRDSKNGAVLRLDQNTVSELVTNLRSRS